MGIKRVLVTSNKTRFTSVHAMLESILRLQPALVFLLEHEPQTLSAAVTALLTDEMFFIELKQLCQLLVPFTLVIMAVQSDNATLADVMRYWLYLARCMSSLRHTDPAFKTHAIAAWNFREQQMRNPLCRLALFLHPWYRGVAAKSDKDWQTVCLEAGRLWKSYKHTKPEVKLLIADMALYRLQKDPFNGELSDGDLNGLKLYWENVQVSATSTVHQHLPALALIVHDIKPHAADPEKMASLMGYFHSARRNQLLSRTTTAMTAIKMHHTSTDRNR